MADETRRGPRRWRLPPPGWRRTVALRRAAAGLLVVLALGLLAAPSVAPSGTPVLVAARDLAPGVALGPADVAVRLLPGELVPAGAFAEPGAVAGRQVVGGVRAGVPDAAGVPVRLADAGVAALLTPGTRVDLVAAGADDAGAVPVDSADPALLAPGAVVLAVLPAPERTAGSAPVVVVALPSALAARVATVSLREEVTVTLR